jgi:hypothetical protein
LLLDVLWLIIPMHSNNGCVLAEKIQHTQVPYVPRVKDKVDIGPQALQVYRQVK